MVKFTRKLLPILLAAPLVLFSGCTQSESPAQEKRPSEQSPSSAPSPLNYDQYRQLYKDMAANLSLTGVQKVEDYTDRGYLVFVEPELTFGKRKVLTLTGEQTDQMTQSKIAYEGEDVAVYVDLIYLEQSLSNDMVFIEGGTKHFKDLKLEEKFQETILSYKNTLIRIGVYAKNEKPIPDGMLNGFGQSVVSFLKNQM